MRDLGHPTAAERTRALDATGKGRRIFQPHQDIQALLELAGGPY